jgi:hypothetical protein
MNPVSTVTVKKNVLGASNANLYYSTFAVCSNLEFTIAVGLKACQLLQLFVPVHNMPEYEHQEYSNDTTTITDNQCYSLLFYM